MPPNLLYNNREVEEKEAALINPKLKSNLKFYWNLLKRKENQLQPVHSSLRQPYIVSNATKINKKCFLWFIF